MTRCRHDDDSCGCPPAPHPPLPVLPPGLPTLSLRQLCGFAEYREAMLSATSTKVPLSAWGARSQADLGVMLLEAWAYVLDVTGFYDARVAERSYLGTAPDTRSARRLTALLGHRQRPAMAARVVLAAEVDGVDPVTVPRGTAFLSEPFDTEASQVFELAEDTVLWPARNRFELAPVRPHQFDGTLRFLPRRGPGAGAVLVIWTPGAAAAVRVAAVDTELGVDGARYLRVLPEEGSSTGLSGLVGLPLSELRAAILRLPVSRTPFADVDGDPSSTLSSNQPTGTSVTLDGLYPQVRPGERAVAEINATLTAVRIESVAQVQVTVDPTSGATTVLTRVTFTPQLSIGATSAFTLHVNPLAAGPLTRPAKTEIRMPDLAGGAALKPPVADLEPAPSGGQLVAVGTGKVGVLLPGSITAGNGAAAFLPSEAAPAFPEPLRIPVRLHGNVIRAVRGETVVDEVLGSGDAGTPFGRFKLKNKPLAWVEDASQPDGRRPELVVRVDNIEWERVDTFFGRGPDERVYVVRQEPEGESTIRFGDGEQGARVPTGVDNIRADYRHGAGAAKPPPGSIHQVVSPVKGLAMVRGPLPATGGADPEGPDELRDRAPAAVLTLGRAVSFADFRALALGFPGVLNAAAEWAWDGRKQRAVVKIWIIADGGDPAADVAAWLRRQAAVDLSIVVEEAAPAPFSSLAISLEIAPRHAPKVVRAAARVALFHAKTGLLAPRNLTIGAPLFRSMLSLRLHEVAGVQSVPSVLLDGVPLPRAVPPGAGKWFDLEAGTTVT